MSDYDSGSEISGLESEPSVDETQPPEPATNTTASPQLSSAVEKANKAAEKVNRVRSEMRASMPSGATHPVWRYYQVYLKAEHKGLAICMLCDEAKAYGSAERKFKDHSPTNLVHHLNTNLPKHKEAYDDVQKTLRPQGSAGRTGPPAAERDLAGGQTQMTKFLKGLEWKDALIRFMAMTNQPISVSV